MASDSEAAELSKSDVLRLSADIVAAYVSRNPVGVGAVHEVLTQVFGTLHHGQVVSMNKHAYVRPIPTGTPGSSELPRTQQFFQRMKSTSELALAMQNPFPIPVVPYRESTYRRVQMSFFY